MNSDDLKGILKGGSNEAPQKPADQKTAKFDELNVLATFHPEGKTYGHMIIDEPKTPFVFEDELPKKLDTAELMEKLRLTSQSATPCFGIEQDSDDSSDDEDFPESVEEKVRRIEFERRRKLHYKEYFSVPLARRLIAEEFGDMFPSEPTCKCEPSSGVDETGPTRATHDTVMEEEHQLLDPEQPSSHSLAHAESNDGGYRIDPEPVLDPSHPCYQQLTAQTNRPLTAETDEALHIASLGYMRSVPSMGEEFSDGKQVRVPNASYVAGPKGKPTKSPSAGTL
ncbi:GL22570 [Drosophila persimilis]|uniref:GL22569 n=1 Tax=Drosophila persimilis TaxID=7234 RepID=B4H196_DROPE|nr:protein phosphatase inhibitor 2 [Drosophila persimilis]XP_002024626.1 protein phosphatase inhibitor 2 [Drosophila persimilis]XP_026849402.1 protein phosphatase inhibitor 2-like [Drosophila persimilis]EDW30073.1 GL22569 [Drosophila persimilis]EDW30074.1 GL22570 [Drosophila persimilis]